MTNLELLQSMTFEEMTDYEKLCPQYYKEKCQSYKNCKECREEWLQEQTSFKKLTLQDTVDLAQMFIDILENKKYKKPTIKTSSRYECIKNATIDELVDCCYPGLTEFCKHDKCKTHTCKECLREWLQSN